MKEIKRKIIMWIAWHLPAEVLMWAYIRAFSIGWEKTNKIPDEVTYADVYGSIKEKFNLDDY